MELRRILSLREISSRLRRRMSDLSPLRKARQCPRGTGPWRRSHSRTWTYFQLNRLIPEPLPWNARSATLRFR